MPRDAFALKIQRELCHPKRFGTFEKRVPDLLTCFLMSEKAKSIAKFDGSEPRRWEGIKGLVASEIDPKCLGTFEKQASGLIRSLSCIID